MIEVMKLAGHTLLGHLVYQSINQSLFVSGKKKHIIWVMYALSVT